MMEEYLSHYSGRDAMGRVQDPINDEIKNRVINQIWNDRRLMDKAASEYLKDHVDSYFERDMRLRVSEKIADVYYEENKAQLMEAVDVDKLSKAINNALVIETVTRTRNP